MQFEEEDKVKVVSLNSSENFNDQSNNLVFLNKALSSGA